MRVSTLTLASLLALGASAGASAQWSPAGPYTFVQGQTYELQFTQPAVANFLAADLLIRYSPQVYEPIALLPGSLDSLLSVLASTPVAGAGGLDQVTIQITPSFSAPLGDYGLNLPAGSMFGVSFKIKDDAPLGTTGGDVATSFAVTFGDPSGLLDEIVIPGALTVATTIVPVPEPETWALMIAGLALIGGAAKRAHRRSAMRMA